MKELTYEQWVEQYEPRENPNAQGESCIWEFEDLKEKNFKVNHIWTLVDGENEESWILPGYHIVNRQGYYVTTYPWESQDIQVNDNEMITVGKAKYSCLSFIEDKLSLNLTDEEMDALHNYYSQL